MKQVDTNIKPSTIKSSENENKANLKRWVFLSQGYKSPKVLEHQHKSGYMTRSDTFVWDLTNNTNKSTIKLLFPRNVRFVI